VFDEARSRLPAAMLDGCQEIVDTQKPSHGILVAADEYRSQRPKSKSRRGKNLVRWCGELPTAFQDLAPLVIVGHARQEIIKAIETAKADLVVAGARGRGAIGRLLLGNTSEHFACHTSGARFRTRCAVVPRICSPHQ
jgi:hypothetical protein